MGLGIIRERRFTLEQDKAVESYAQFANLLLQAVRGQRGATGERTTGVTF